MTVVADPTRGALVAELAGVVGARHEARFIVEEAVAASGDLDAPAVAMARRMAARRAAGEPLQYVFGHWPFRTLDLVVDARVLIPRPETEQVVEVALAEARRLQSRCDGRLVVIDAGTGSGAIALSLAFELGPARVREVWAIDTSGDALAVAARNLDVLRRRHTWPLPAVELVQGCWFELVPPGLYGAVHLVVSNPPYVSAAEWGLLEPEVRAEPYRALVAGPASDGTPGLGDVEAILVGARDVLASPGAAVVELAPHQAGRAERMARRLGFTEVSVEPDLSGRPRALVARVHD